MRMYVGKVLALSGLCLGCCSIPGYASMSICDAVANNIVQNCGFENGVYTSGQNGQAPVDWTPNQGFTDHPDTSRTISLLSNSGTHALALGNYDSEAAGGISQTLKDVAGASYRGSLYVNYGGAGGGDANAFFDAEINGANYVALNDTAPGTYTKYTFSFIGTGSDVLTLIGATNPGAWFVDDVVVATPIVASTPEPATFAFLGGLTLLALRPLFRRKFPL